MTRPDGLAQHEREMLVGAFLDVTLAAWIEWVTRVGDDGIPTELHERVGHILAGLGQAEGADPAMYVQSLALLSDQSLVWLVDQVGVNPL